MSAAEPRQALTIRSKYRGPAFRAIETILREDPVLAEHVKTWRSREGHDEDMQMPGWDMCPLIALSPIPRPNTILGVDESKINFAVSVELFVQGSCVEDILALWEAVEDAVVDDKPFRGGKVRDYLCSILSLSPGPRGVMVLRPQMPAFFDVSLKNKANDPGMQSGIGILTCFLSRPA